VSLGGRKWGSKVLDSKENKENQPNVCLLRGAAARPKKVRREGNGGRVVMNGSEGA